jgi:hypothetical protein
MGGDLDAIRDAKGGTGLRLLGVYEIVNGRVGN